MSEYAVNFQEFKQIVSDFFKRLKQQPVLTCDQLDGAIKAIHLHFIYLTGTDNDKHQAEILIQLVGRYDFNYRMENNIPR